MAKYFRYYFDSKNAPCISFGIHRCQVCGDFCFKQVDVGPYVVCASESCQAEAESRIEQDVETYFAGFSGAREIEKPSI